MTEKQVEELIQRYAEGIASDEEKRQLDDWYRFSSMSEVEWLSANPKEEEQVYHRMLQRMKKEIAARRTNVFQFPMLKVAALFLLVIGGGLLVLWYKNTYSHYYITLTNPSGKIQVVNLPDGSQAWLNAASTLRYRKEFTEHREIKLEGEAFFMVRHDASHPFSVDAGGIQTTVLGTSFNVKAYKEDSTASVSVVNGRVKVQSDSKELAVLTPSKQVFVDQRQGTMQIATIDTTAVATWRQGKLLFDGKSFLEIANTLERWYGVHIVFANNGMQNCRYYMSFDNDKPLEKLLPTMAQITEMKYIINHQANTITLSGKPCP